MTEKELKRVLSDWSYRAASVFGRKRAQELNVPYDTVVERMELQGPFFLGLVMGLVEEIGYLRSKVENLQRAFEIDCRAKEEYIKQIRYEDVRDPKAPLGSHDFEKLTNYLATRKPGKNYF